MIFKQLQGYRFTQLLGYFSMNTNLILDFFY
ncbi:Putative protein [Zobellia galactanivorans]|uniref:Uncharacterized protein n=1 Tax=Zobellia galactanivorans (strain DSM 12802 / CCUG 47099 / CIP 106680 / NCIMB 13871 / Dsij) TaxID=63186 RepID=G0LCV1_ZOBGA|nr:Putative protein [Zobellia galactanivorans]